MQTLTPKKLIGLSRLTLQQTMGYLDQYNYQLRNSQFVIMNNDFENPFSMPVSTLTDIASNGEISYTKEGSKKEEKMSLGKDRIMIIYKESKPKFAVFYD